MNWRVIDFETHDAAMNMAIDQSMAENVANTQGKPTIRFYQWKENSLSLGAYQTLSDINLEACKHHNISLVRRMSGGRAVYHSTQDLTYSVIVPISLYNYSITTAYRSICNSILIALKRLGIKGKLESSNDVVVSGKKISGNASKLMENGYYLQHGTLHTLIDHELLSEIFRHDFKVFEDNATSILEHGEFSQEKIKAALFEGFTIEKDFNRETLSPSEMRRAEYLSESKYSTISLPKESIGRKRGACSVMRNLTDKE